MYGYQYESSRFENPHSVPIPFLQTVPLPHRLLTQQISISINDNSRSVTES